MKLGKIVSLCKKQKRIVLFDRRNEQGEVIEQWIGDGTACYLADGLPILSAATVGALFEVPAKDAEKWDIREEILPPSIDFEDTADGETILEEYGVSLNFRGITLKAMHVHGEPIFADVRYLSPFLDSLESTFLFRRTTPGGLEYIAVKVGFILKGIVPPCRIESERFIESLSCLSRDVSRAFEVDRETGEYYGE